MTRRWFLCLLGLLLLAGCQNDGQEAGKVSGEVPCTYGQLLQKQDLVLVALSSFQKKRIGAEGPDWRPLSLLQRPCAGGAPSARVEIDDRTEFYAFFSPRQGLKAGQAVVFSWFFTPARVPYARPVVKILVLYPQFPRPLAVDYIWSAPDMGGKLLSLGGLRSVRSKADWERSRVFGPRMLRVSRLKGFDHNQPLLGPTLAEFSFEVHETGVQVY
ncbi:MAG: hypothetical protein C4525_12835 [Desulfarculus sp.]|nr:MAG: hypothetical protein C4525_12835 [Desulfarculus sp.]